MKRIAAMLLSVCIAISLNACGFPTDDYDLQDNSTEYTAGDTFTVGNYTMTVPDGYSAEKSNDLFCLSSENSDGFISIFAVDISPLDEAHVHSYIASQSEAFVDEEATRYNEKIQEVTFGQLSVYLDLYAEESPDGLATIKTNGSFTDSWYGYTVAIQCSAESDKISEDFNAFAAFCASAEYVGEEPRFDFIQ